MSMHIGIDLAWSFRARTGLAAVDQGGALVASTGVVTDGQIDDWLTGLGAGVVSVAIDAPLIVTNPTGMRECERRIGQSYGAYEASCHTSNLGNPHFNPPRAAVLAGRHGWHTDPANRGEVAAPVAIEVYPHAAMVGLFELGRTLKYKKGPVPSRRTGMLAVLDRMETLAELALVGNPRWQQIRLAADRAKRQIDLNRIEDEVDAILCAHLAWLWYHRPGALQVYGDAAAGCIIAPPRPTHPHTPRVPRSGRG
ncbi:DUF429 domain-containing protein [Pseudactinotalea sp. Z1739]|uniref:DUF429 domain-containing protein n=1 Tax=Pseudactinotalea sp. Z1739 TaxID=3413028 RepID=UPI003C7D6B11